MTVRPNLAEFRALAQEHRMIPVWRVPCGLTTH